MTSFSFSHGSKEHKINIPASTLHLLHSDSYKREKYLIYECGSQSIKLIDTTPEAIDAIFKLNNCKPHDLYLEYSDQYGRGIQITGHSIMNEPWKNFDLCKFCHNTFAQHAEEIKRLKEQVAHLMYQPGAPGYQEAKTDFENLCH